MATKKTTRKTAAKKPAAKKTTAKARKAPAKKAPAKKAATTAKAIPLAKGKAMTKAQILSAISERAELTKKEVGHVMDLLEEIMLAHLKKGAVGSFKFNGLINMKAVKKPARKARKGVNPFTGEEIMIKAKPAHRAVRVSALKKLKEVIK